MMGIIFYFILSDAYSQGRSQSAPGRAKSEAAKSKGKGTSVPIDGGLGLLLAAGAAYGLKRIKDQKLKDIS
ncbi:hypothetical protein KIH41_13575 [Litoribacter ruber]|nr:hypothetical protein [Litoribacter ruber]